MVVVTGESHLGSSLWSHHDWEPISSKPFAQAGADYPILILTTAIGWTASSSIYISLALPGNGHCWPRVQQGPHTNVQTLISPADSMQSTWRGVIKIFKWILSPLSVETTGLLEMLGTKGMVQMGQRLQKGLGVCVYGIWLPWPRIGEWSIVSPQPEQFQDTYFLVGRKLEFAVKRVRPMPGLHLWSQEALSDRHNYSLGFSVLSEFPDFPLLWCMRQLSHCNKHHRGCKPQVLTLAILEAEA